MKGLTSKSRQNFFTIATIVGLLVVFSFYFFVYVPQKERELEKENFRVLTRVTDNIDSRVDEYRAYINERARIAVKREAAFEQKKTTVLPKKKMAPVDTFSIFSNAYTGNLNIDLREIPELQLIYFSPVDKFLDQSLVKDRLSNLTKPYFLFIRDTCSVQGKPYEYGFTLNAECFQYLINDKAFESCFLRRDSIIISGPNSGVLAGAEDSLLVATNGLKTGRFFSQEISGSEKKIFAEPFRLGSEDHFVLCGVMDGEAYYAKTKSLSGNVILIVLLLLFILALSLPFVKFLLMSKHERLKISDALMAGITVLLGTSVLMLVLLDLYTYMIPGKEEREEQMAELSVEIGNNFQNELKAVCHQLTIYDQLMGDKKNLANFTNNFVSLLDDAEISKPDKNTYSEGDKNIPEVKLSETVIKLIRPTVYKNFSQVFWTDSSGMQLFKWATGPERTPMINVSNRLYFQNVIANKGWSLPLDSTNFYLEGIYSRTTGQNLVVVAKKSNLIVLGKNVETLEEKQRSYHTGVVAMMTRLNSVMNPVIPIGNGFCIIDANGNVIFHSDRSKNLSENFLDECSARNKIKAAIYSRVADYFSTSYRGGDYKMYIRPVNNLPFYLVTFQDNLYPVTSNAEVLSLSVLFVILFFLFICLQVIVLRIITYRESQLKAKIFSFEWLWPLKEKQRAYQHILIFLVPSFFLMLLFLHSATPIESLFIFFASSVFVFAFIYLKIDQFKNNAHRKTRQEFFSRVNKNIIAASLAMLIILNIISSYVIYDLVRLCVFQVVFLTFAISILAFNIPVFSKFSFRRCYFALQLGILTLISIIPTFTFFRISFEKEAEISIRHMQLELAAELDAKSGLLNKTYNLADPSPINIYSSPFSKTRILPSDFQGMKNDTDSISGENDFFIRMSIALTPAYNDIISRENNLARSALGDAWRWEKYGNKFMLLHFYGLQRSGLSNDVESLKIVSEVPAYKLPLPFGVHKFGVRGSLFWLGILLCIVGLYRFIRFFVRILFSIDFFRNNQYNKLGIVSLQGYFGTTNVFLVGAPYSGKSDWLKKQVSDDKVRYEINLNTLKKQEDINAHLEKCKAADIIVIDHFEYGFRDHAVAKRRLRLFEELKRLENKRILVVSNIHPRLFLEEYPEEPVAQTDGEEEKASVEIEFDDCERWKKILEGYHKIYFPACGVVEKETVPHADLVDRECSNSYFLRSRKDVIRESLKNENPDHPLTDEEIILRIESMSHVYYNSIWSSLSEEEQYILYDIAQDGLVNLKNREVLTMLLHKGLLVYENRFKMMNESFRNFVLSEVSADDALELEQKVKETGSWNYFKTPVIIILITIAMFIAITQEETFNSIIAFITTFAAGIPIIFRLLGMVTSMKMGKGKAT